MTEPIPISRDRIRAAIFQGPSAGRSCSDRLATLDTAAAQAAAEGAALLVLPEMFLTGYNIGADALRSLAEPMDGPSARQAAYIARRHGVTLLYGYPERAADKKLYNAALLVAPGGPVANYRKLHLFGDAERAVFTPGDSPSVMAEIGGLRVGILICYDVEFPEMVRGLALQGADIVAVPTALMQPYAFVTRVLVRARAYENQVFVIYANRCGSEGDLDYLGESCIVGPDGTELVRAGVREEFITAWLDPAYLARSRAQCSYFADRLPRHYGNVMAH